MAQITQTKYSDSFTGLQRRTIDDAIALLDDRRTPAISLLGLSKANGWFQNDGNRKLEWWNDQYRERDGALSLAATAASDATAITVSTAGALLKKDDVIKIGDEKILVTEINAAGTVATISRGIGTTTGASLTTGAAFSILYSARPEGSDIDFGPLQSPSSAYNYIQTFQIGLKMTYHAMRQNQFGINNDWDYQAEKAIPDLMWQVENMIFQGERIQNVANTTRGMAGGLDTFFTAHTQSVASTALAIGNFQSMMNSCNIEGAMPETLLMHHNTVQLLTNLYTTSEYLRVDFNVDTLGRPRPTIRTPWGQLSLVESAACPTSKIYVMQSEYVGLYEYRAPEWVERSPGGDYTQAELLADYTLVVRNPKAHGVITLT